MHRIALDLGSVVHLPLVSSSGSLKAYTASYWKVGRWSPLLAAAAIACGEAEPNVGARGGDGGGLGHDAGSQTGNAGTMSGNSGAGASEYRTISPPVSA